MTISKSKKRRKRKANKKQKLSIIDPKFIQKNQCWLPENESKYKGNTNSWFDRKVIRVAKPDKKHYSIETNTLRVKRIEVFPTPEQKVKLLDWLETYRRLYNLVIKHRHKFINKGKIMSYIKLRKIIRNDYLPKATNLYNEIYKLYLPEKQRKIASIPAHSIWNAIHDVCKAFNSAMANKKAGNIKSFRLRYKKQSNPNQTLVFEPQSFSKTCNTFALTALGEMKSSEPFGKPTHDCRLSYNSETKKFVLWKPVDKINVFNGNKAKLIALDPGLRTFQNGYSPNSICLKFGTEKTMDKLKNLFNRIYNVDKIKKSPKNKKCNYKKYVSRLRRKITNMVTDLHWKTANYLCKNFDTILVGNMSTTGIVKRNKSVLNKSSKQLLISLSHYTFIERLKSKAEEYEVKCLIVDESYTTKTCGKCGEQNQKVGGSKVFKCSVETCNFTMDRDYNAGRNIYLKALSNKLV